MYLILLKYKCIFLVSLGMGSAASAVELTPYVAKYAVELKAGIKVKADAEIQLVHSPDNGSYEFRSVTKAKGIAKAFRSRPVTETSEFRIADGKIQPVRYEFFDGSKKNKRGEKSSFDWAGGVVHTTYKEEEKTLALDNGTLDRNLLPVVLMQSCENLDSKHAKVVSRGTIRNYRLEHMGNETLKTKIGTLETVKYRQFREGSSRSTVSWISPEHQCVVVRVHQFKEDKRVGKLDILELNGL